MKHQRPDKANELALKQVAATVFISNFDKTFDFVEKPKSLTLLLKFLRACQKNGLLDSLKAQGFSDNAKLKITEELVARGTNADSPFNLMDLCQLLQIKVYGKPLIQPRIVLEVLLERM